MESRVRLGLLRARLPEPELNVAVTDADGQWLAEGDFVWRWARVVAEYDGVHHADPEHCRRDARRRRSIEAGGWTYVQLTAATARDPRDWAAAVEQLRRLLA